MAGCIEASGGAESCYVYGVHLKNDLSHTAELVRL